MTPKKKVVEKPKPSSTFRIHHSIPKRYRVLIEHIEARPDEHGVKSEFMNQLMIDGLRYREMVTNGGGVAVQAAPIPTIPAPPKLAEAVVIPNANDDGKSTEDALDDHLFGQM